MATDEIRSRTAPRGGESPASQPTQFTARQPILNSLQQVIGYELLFRTGWQNSFRGESDDATRQTLDNYVSSDALSPAENHLAFINCTREALVGRLVTLLPQATTVLEILETVEPDEELVDACKDLRRQGYRFALDDFLPRPDMRPLIELADYFKIDFQLCDARVRQEIRELVRGSNAALLAEKVEDQQEFDAAVAEGYTYFQGYFFCRPKILANRTVPPNRMNYLRLLVELTRKPLNLDEVVRLVGMEPSLCYRLLRLANSTQWGARGDVTSVRGAFMLVGEDRFRMLVSVATSTIMGQTQSSALISLSLERARFCELLAPQVGQDATEQFMLGLLSLVDAMLGVPMESIASSLPLRAEARAALAGANNSAAVPLCLIRSFETGAWGTCASAANGLGIGEAKLTSLYLDAVKWAADSIAASR